MQIIKTSDWHPAIKVVGDRLDSELRAGHKVLWLVSGGSNIFSCASIMQQLDPEVTKSLTVMLMDERYGKVGHEDSNDAQLAKAGFDPKQALYHQILQENTSFEATRDRFDHLTRQAFTDNEIIIGLFGLGTDGHTAGILPYSAAVDSPDLVAAYDSDPHQRLTMTHHALKRISAAYVLAYGTDKKTPLEILSTKLIPYAEQPIQIIKELPEAYVFNDQIGETP